LVLAGLMLAGACDGQASNAPASSDQVARLVGNLQADATVIPAFDLSSGQTTSNFAAGLPELAPGHEALILFRRAGPGQWAWLAIEADSARGPARGLAGGTLAFDDQGRLTAVGRDADYSGVPRLPFALEFGSAFPTGSGTDGITQYRAASFMEAH
jgi:hypothetical protein